MTDENDDVKLKDTDAQASEDQGSEDSEENESDESTSKKGVDYKAELAVAEERLKKAEFTIEKSRKKKGDSSDEGDEGKVSRGEVEKLASDRAAEIAKEQIDNFSQGLVADVVEEGIGALAFNADEAKLIRFHYDNTIQKSGHTRSAIMTDLRRCKMLANESAIANQNTELAAALRSEQGKNKSGQVAGEKRQSAQKVVLTSDEEVLAQRMYERAVKNGKQNSKNKPYTLEDARKELFTAKNS